MEPYSIVEIAYVAETVRQDRRAVEAKCVTPAIVLVIILYILLLTTDYADYRK